MGILYKLFANNQAKKRIQRALADKERYHSEHDFKTAADKLKAYAEIKQLMDMADMTMEGMDHRYIYQA